MVAPTRFPAPKGEAMPAWKGCGRAPFHIGMAARRTSSRLGWEDLPRLRFRAGPDADAAGRRVRMQSAEERTPTFDSVLDGAVSKVGDEGEVGLGRGEVENLGRWSWRWIGLGCGREPGPTPARAGWAADGGEGGLEKGTRRWPVLGTQPRWAWLCWSVWSGLARWTGLLGRGGWFKL